MTHKTRYQARTAHRTGHMPDPNPTYVIQSVIQSANREITRIILEGITQPALATAIALQLNMAFNRGETYGYTEGYRKQLNQATTNAESEANPAQLLDQPIEELDLTVRTYNCLKREGIHFIRDLVARTEEDLTDIRNFGVKSIAETKTTLNTRGLSLRREATNARCYNPNHTHAK